MKKTFNLMMTAVLCLSSVIALSSCSKDDFTTNSLKGKWNFTHFEFSFYGETIDSEDESYYRDYWVALEFADNSVLISNIYDGDCYDSSYSYSFTGDRLVILGMDFPFRKISNKEFSILWNSRYVLSETDFIDYDYTEYTTYKGKVIYRRHLSDEYCYEDNGNYYGCYNIGKDFYDEVQAYYKKQ